MYRTPLFGHSANVLLISMCVLPCPYIHALADLLERGFEWTLLWGTPTNPPPMRYKLAPKCCSMAYNNATKK